MNNHKLMADSVIARKVLMTKQSRIFSIDCHANTLAMTIEKVILIMIFFLAGFLYFYNLGELPNSLSDDEATVGYNAYSILQTRKDEFGMPLPIAFRFFGAYTPPLYVYLVVPVIKMFGLGAVSIRAPSGVSTLLGILIVYFFIKRLNLFRSPLAGLVGAFVFAISPWVIYYARIGYEVTFGYIIFSLGSLLLWSGISKNKLSLSGVTLLSISTYIAHSERYLVPLFLLAILVFFQKIWFAKKNQGALARGLLILLITQIPNLYLLTTKAFWVKSGQLGYTDYWQWLNNFVSQLLTYFSPRALFGTSPDINLQHTVPEIGLFYSWLIIPFFIGLYRLYLKLRSAGGKFLAIMLLTAPIPGSFSGQYISIQRVMPMIVPLVLIIALGFDFILERVRWKFFAFTFLVLSGLSLLLFWRSYFVLFPKERFPYWSYGYEQLARIAIENPLDHFVIDSSRATTVYIGLLFHLKHPPSEFQKQFSWELIRGYYDAPPVDISYQFANLELRGIIWEKDIFEKQILVGDALAVSSTQAAEHFLTKVFEIEDPNGKAILFGYRTDPEKKKADNRIKEQRKTRGPISR